MNNRYCPNSDNPSPASALTSGPLLSGQDPALHSPLGDSASVSSGGPYCMDSAGSGDSGSDAGGGGPNKKTFKKDLMKRYCK